ncbi:SMI1/KNR4 family protein [Rhizobium lusitanum]|uniref:SMI1/KNR4 family protein n=1 Tax=Rhizobium lusitanum TaxID=293958 RepID=A0A1C3WEF3_9HYPH|nr:SMI1/KNR4 family protein [Rhizobium lusitanum]SCB38094.1 hypothetical protein GA0061101_110128 [Rhizobium lusitanum]
MTDKIDALETLIELGRNPMTGVYLNPVAEEDALDQMQVAARRDLDELVPEAYVALLRLTNGIQINCAYFKTAEDLVPENLDLESAEVIVLGHAGNMAQFVFDRRDRQFHTINMGFPDERFETFDSFADMLATVLREQCG